MATHRSSLERRRDHSPEIHDQAHADGCHRRTCTPRSADRDGCDDAHQSNGRKTGEADVIVSFLGPPVFTDAQVARLGGKRPKLVAFCTGAMPDQVDLPRVFEQKLLHVAIISRASPTTAGPEPANLRAWFDRMYQVITPANLAELPSPRGTRREVKSSP